MEELDKIPEHIKASRYERTVIVAKIKEFDFAITCLSVCLFVFFFFLFYFCFIFIYCVRVCSIVFFCVCLFTCMDMFVCLLSRFPRLICHQHPSFPMWSSLN